MTSKKLSRRLSGTSQRLQGGGAQLRRVFLSGLRRLYAAGRLRFSGDHVALKDSRAFLRHLAPLREKGWVVYAKPPFSGPEAVLAYLARYTHRVAISNSRLIAFDHNGVTFKWKDYRSEGRDRYTQMTLAPDEFIRRFLIHVLPHGFHRIRHYGLFAKATCAANIARARQLLCPPKPQDQPTDPAHDDKPLSHPCPCCGGRMILIEVFERGATPRHRPTRPVTLFSIDSS